LSGRNPAAVLGEARAHSRQYIEGGHEAFGSYRDLLALLFNLTVGAVGNAIVVNVGADGPDRGVISPQGFPERNMALLDGRFLKFNINLFLGETDRAPGRTVMKVRAEVFQYQLEPSAESDAWVFRYEYDRETKAGSPHPPAHLHVKARLLDEVAAVIPEGARPLERVHFPTGRVSVPGIIRLLVEQFGCPTDEPPDCWRPVLAAVEEEFHAIAHQPLSGPKL
jgi:hypothetical protein